ncbi:ATP-binding protein [Pelosinus sp. sgz500959]|uniref:ATP-binding protein n=1 Tax=Pelosinus sp. sgz500959 TaxID=3242472 RepID=UPI00366FB632
MTKMTSNLDQLLIYRNIIEDELIQKTCAFLATTKENLPFDLFYKLIQKSEQLGLTDNVLKSYLVYLISLDENTLSVMAEQTGGYIGKSLRLAALHDLAILKNFINQDLSFFDTQDLLINHYLPTNNTRKQYLEELTPYFLDESKSDSQEKILDKLLQHYVSYGYGELVNHTAFRWNRDKGLEGIVHCDPIQLNDLIGYDRQKKVLVQNTEAFITGKPACNVLLTGDRGTGKSSSVKALVNHYSSHGLRLVEVAKHDLPDLHGILKQLGKLGKKFIIFLDDLSFEEFEIEYKHLKSVMEGGIESKPSNVLIYATSNRMHLIRESWNDRTEKSNDIQHFDTVNEKLSLSDRFGITVSFFSPTQDEYLRIVEELARKNNITMPLDLLRSESLKWERSHAGRSGRKAQQFITHVLGEDKAE